MAKGEGKTLDEALKDAANNAGAQSGTWLKVTTISVKTAPSPVRISDYRIEAAP